LDHLPFKIVRRNHHFGNSVPIISDVMWLDISYIPCINQCIIHALYPNHKPLLQLVGPISVAMLPYQHSVTNKISSLLAKLYTKTIHIPAIKYIHMFRSATDNFGLEVPAIYCIPCEVYVWQTGRTIETNCKEHMRHIYLGHPEKSAVTEHNI